jgi:hypothetical protein
MMSFYRPDLEMRCIRPGRWMVEGVLVERIGSRTWRVLSEANPTFSTLTFACEWIYDRQTDRMWRVEGT